jgi:hypothetical protein
MPRKVLKADIKRRIIFCITPAQHKYIAERSRANGISMSEYIRALIMRDQAPPPALKG